MAIVISSHLTLSTIFMFFTFFQSVETENRMAGVTASGDFIVGGIFPVHEGVNGTNESLAPHLQPCIKLDGKVLVMVLSMINAVEVINRSPLLTACNVTLGYRILDSCSDVSTALRAAGDLSLQDHCPSGSSPLFRRQRAIAVIGEAYSEMSIAIARQLTLKMIPQISYSSTAVILSDKQRFPAFVRTVPNDQHQAAAIVRLLTMHGWTWVGFITTDDEYGSSAMDNFLRQASEQNICVAFKSILPRSVTSSHVRHAIRETAQTILISSQVQIIVSFVTPALMKFLFHELSVQALRTGPSTQAMRRVWLASDGWSTSSSARGTLTLQDIGHVVGFSFKSGDLTSIGEYLSRLETASQNYTHNNCFLREFYQELSDNEGLSNSQERTDSRGSSGGRLAARAIELLREYIAPDMVLSIEMAVSAIAQAVASICHNRDCKTAGTVQPWQVLQNLRRKQFQLGGRNYRFDGSGDINLGYSVTMWRSEGSSVYAHDVVAEYHPFNHSFTYTDHPTRFLFQDLQNIVSKCSNSCLPGEFKKSPDSPNARHICCYTCMTCPENHYSNKTDMTECLVCNRSTEWSPAGSSGCLSKELLFFSLQDGFAVVLLSFSVMGILLTLLVSAMFLYHRDTLVVRAAGGSLSQVILYSLVVSYISAMLFAGRPNSLQCKARQVLFGISFTLCVSCILVKTLKILSAFQWNPELQQILRKLYQPHIIVGVCMALQVAICICWLVLKSPDHHIETSSKTVLENCHEGSYVALGVMLGYIAVLAFVCFICAFIGRKLPNRYNDAKFITFSMLLYLISWLLFIPVYVTTSGKYLPAVEMVVILISNYGILGCHFFIKCYTILFRSDTNIRNAFRSDLYKYVTDSVQQSQCSTSYPPHSVLSIPRSSVPTVCGQYAPRALPSAPSLNISLEQTAPCELSEPPAVPELYLPPELSVLPELSAQSEPHALGSQKG